MSSALPPRRGGGAFERPTGSGGAPPRWTPQEAESFLLSMDLFGMRFGLDRMRRLMTVLDLPHERFESIHVVGTNGKSSTTRFVAAILHRHGLAMGAYMSPHLVSYTERIQLGESDVEPETFALAVAQAAWAAERVNRTLSGGDRVTQFELLTAAAYWVFAQSGVQVAVLEAGLGGRYDATNVIDSRVAVLTNVGLEHTRWLGPTIKDIAGEKLAVVGEDSTLVVGAGASEELVALVEGVAQHQHTRVIYAPDGHEGEDLELLAGGRYQRRNFALAREVARAYLESAGLPLDHEAVREAAASTTVPGRFQRVGEDPPTLFDGAHNPASVAALAESLPDFTEGRPLGVVLGVLDDKDAAGMLLALRPQAARIWVTAAANRRALPPPTLESLAHQVGFAPEQVVREADAKVALAQARGWAAGEGAVVLATGSIYLIGDLLRTAEEQS